MTGVCDAGNAPRPTQTLPSFPPVSPLSFPPVSPLSFPQVVSGNPVSFLLPPKSPHAQPCSLLPWLPAIPLDSRFRGNDRRVRHGQRPTTNPNMAGPQLPAIPLDSRSPITHVGDRLRGHDRSVRRGQPPRPTQTLLSFPPAPFCPSHRLPSVIPASPLLSFPQVVSGNPVSFLLPPKSPYAQPQPDPHPGSLLIPLDSRFRGNDSPVRHGQRPTTNPNMAGPQLPAIPLDSRSPITHVGDRLRGNDSPVRRGHPPRPTPFCHSRRPPPVIPAGCKRESSVFSPPPKAEAAPHAQPQPDRPLAPCPFPWIPAFAGMTVLCDTGSAPRPRLKVAQTGLNR